MKTGVACWAAGISCLFFSLLHLFGISVGMELLFAVTVLFVGLSVCVAGKRNAIYWEMRQLFAVSVVILGVEIFVGLVMQKDMVPILTYGIAYLVLTFLALNIFRFGRTIDKKGKMFYALHLGLYLGVCGACAAIVDFFSKTGGKILEIILTPFAMLLAALVSLGSGVTSFLSNKVEELEPVTEKVEEQVVQNQQAIVEQNISNDASGGMPDGLWELLVVVVLVLFLVYVVYRIYRFYQGRCVRTEEVQETVGTIEAIGRKSFGKISLFKTNREKIRKEYAKHMRMVRVKGYRIGKSSTSLDIYNEAKIRLEDGGQNEERIRELYRKARYSEEEITDEEVREMRQLV